LVRDQGTGEAAPQTIEASPRQDTFLDNAPLARGRS